MFKEKYPKSSKIDIAWMKNNEMGPNSVWLMEYLTNELTINSDMKVLDLGCGKAMSSIFLAKEYGVKVWAFDLWISPTDNYTTIIEDKVDDLLYPIPKPAKKASP